MALCLSLVVLFLYSHRSTAGVVWREAAAKCDGGETRSFPRRPLFMCVVSFPQDAQDDLCVQQQPPERTQRSWEEDGAWGGATAASCFKGGRRRKRRCRCRNAATPAAPHTVVMHGCSNCFVHLQAPHKNSVSVPSSLGAYCPGQFSRSAGPAGTVVGAAGECHADPGHERARVWTRRGGAGRRTCFCRARASSWNDPATASAASAANPTVCLRVQPRHAGSGPPVRRLGFPGPRPMNSEKFDDDDNDNDHDEPHLRTVHAHRRSRPRCRAVHPDGAEVKPPASVVDGRLEISRICCRWEPPRHAYALARTAWPTQR